MNMKKNYAHSLRNLLRLASAALLVLACGLRPALAATAYTNDFQGMAGSAPGSEWSMGTIQSAPNPDYAGSRRFLGEFVNDNVTLSLGGLGTHGFVTVEFDLYLLRSWDGAATDYGSDFFGLRADGNPLFRETFSNGHPTPGQSFCGGAGPCAPMTGASERYSLGYTFDNWVPGTHPAGYSEWMDSVYHLSFTFAHQAGSLQLAFFGEGLQPLWVQRGNGGYWDESWGLDNVHVSLQPVPEPHTWVMLLAGFLLLGAVARRRLAATDFS